MRVTTVRRARRFHAFLVVSGLLIMGAVVAGGLLVGRFFKEHVLAHEVDHVAADVQLEAHRHLLPDAFEFSDERPRTSGFDEVFGGIAGIFRIKAFDLDGRVIWSNEPRLIGMAFPDDPHLIRALRGSVTTMFGSPVKRENLYETTHQQIAEVYVPILVPGSTRLLGVIEVYKDTTALVLDIRRTQRVLWTVAATMGFLLYVSLAFVVWSASTGERRAIARLKKQNRELAETEEELRQANQTLSEAQAALVAKERLAAVGQVVVGLHHAILNPLTGILGALQVLKHASPSARTHVQAIGEAEFQARKIGQLVKKLADLQDTTTTPYVGQTIMLDLDLRDPEEIQPAGDGRQ